MVAIPQTRPPIILTRSAASEVIFETALEDHSWTRARPFNVVLRIAGAADRNGVRPVVLVENILGREIEGQIGRGFVLQIQVDEIVRRCGRIGRGYVAV